ncbi:MAG: RsmF rRNA methyltransferase first C-terminal domain-containing protein [Clostridia bacterium]|nr:RsmF rRNA methyltransferase first C-terminal domain-containing protein [Clostridia bacterium]
MLKYLKEWIDLTPWLDQPAFEGVRFNCKKISRQDFLRIVPFEVKPSPFYEDGFYLQSEGDGNHPYHLAGLYYFQEPSAMSAVTALQLQGEERVLDLCAAPGSKATAIASKLKGGLLVANEIQAGRAKILQENMERMGVSRAVITNNDSAAVAKALPEYFDKVLVDSPCSGEGMFRKYPRILEEWTEELVALCRDRSREVLENAAKTLRPDGRLVYSTCTFNLEENEKTILWFLENHPDFHVVETGIPGGRPGFLGLEQAVRIFPADGGEGHFVCAMERDGDGGREAPRFKVEKHPDALAALQELLKISVKGNLIRRGNNFYWVDEDLPDPPGLRILRAGMQVLELKGRQWKPAHHLAMCLPRELFRYALELDVEQARRYVNGQTVFCDQKGYGVVTVAGVPLGFIKSSDGVGKNHYPKGLRTLK